MQRLNIGCGQRFRSGWTNIDSVPQDPSILEGDVLKGLPFSSGSFDLIYHSHVLEHFTKHDGQAVLTECRRLLKPEGILRVVVPDLAKITREYLLQLERALKSRKEEDAEKHEWSVLVL